MLISEILRRKGSEVATIRPDVAAMDAAREMRRLGIGALVVTTDGNTIEGILSERDLVWALAHEGEQAISGTVGDLMTTTVFTCTPRATADELMAVMTERRIRHIPIVDDGELAGIVSIGDVVKNRVEELLEENQSLHDYLTSGR